MNVRASERKPTNYRQMIVLGLVVLAVAYHFSRPTLQKWFPNVNLPSITEQDRQQAERDRQSDGKDFKYDAKLPDTDKANPNKSNGSKTGQSPTSARTYLKDIGGNRYTSPAGLLFTPSRAEHRIDHVLKHCKDDTSKPAHGIFIGDEVEVFKTIDEAYEQVKAKSRRVESQKDRGKDTYTVSMNRKVGYDGGAKGKRNGGRDLTRIKLVLVDGNRVITAFPTK
jgi:hypothetical protein